MMNKNNIEMSLLQEENSKVLLSNNKEGQISMEFSPELEVVDVLTEEDLIFEDGEHEAPFGHFYWKDQNVVAESEDGVVWNVYDEKQLSFGFLLGY